MDFPGHQIPFASRIKSELKTPVIGAGVLDNPILAESVLSNEMVDLVAVGRGMLRNPYWATYAAQQLQYNIDNVPKQYKRAY